MTWLLSPFVFGIPGILFIWLVVTVIMYILLSHTSFGCRLYAVESNRASAHLSGISVNGMLVLTYALCGFFSALVGFFFVGYTSTVFMKHWRRLCNAFGGGSGDRRNFLGWRRGKLLWFGWQGAIVLTVLEAILTTVRIGQAGRYMIHGLVLIALPHLLWTSTAVKAITLA